MDERLAKIEQQAVRARQALDALLAEVADLRASGEAPEPTAPPESPEPSAAPPAQASPEPPVDPPAAPTPAHSTELQGARLIALKMAMDGASREEVAKHLSDELGIGDSGSLLDEVFARAGK